MEAQIKLAAGLRGLCLRLKSEFPGVWHARTLDDLLILADELPELAEKGIAPGIQMWWQPRLPNITKDATELSKKNTFSP